MMKEKGVGILFPFFALDICFSRVIFIFPQKQALLIDTLYIISEVASVYTEG